MRKSSKFWISFSIIFAVALAIFIVGWDQLTVPAGSTGVMVTKTSGVIGTAVESGKFSWHWQHLIPTNVSMRCFSAVPYAKKTEIKGELPSASILSAMVEGTPDFSYQFQIKTQIRITNEGLVSFVRNTDAKSRDELKDYEDKTSMLLAERIVEYFIKQSMENNETVKFFDSNTEEIADAIGAKELFPNFKINSITVNVKYFPDMEVYNIARGTYIDYQKQVKNAVNEISTKQTYFTAQDYIQLEYFAKWGKILTEYPILIEFLKVSDSDALEVFKQNFKNKN